nr:Uma2 family endonuclease [uncultured Albidiferax sp.]
MGLPLKNPSLPDFVAWENAQPTRNEFYRGEVFAMVGPRRVYGEVVVNVLTALKHHLKGSPCRVYSESMKLQVADDALFYPDVFVTCDAQDLRTDRIFRAPTLVLEVLSSTTAGFDRGLKFATYRRIPSLQEYLLIDPVERSVELFRRNAQGLFELHDMTAASHLVLASVGLEMPIADVFEGVEPGDTTDETPNP